jgi:hypothetical protein
MESALVGIGGVLFVVVLLGSLHRLEAGRRRRMLQDVTRKTPVKRYDMGLQGDVLPAEDVSLTTYQRIPAADPLGYVQTTQRAQHAPTLQASFAVPALTATFTAIALTLACGVLALAFGWSGRVVALTFALSLVVAWLWRLGFADKVLWSVESWSGRDLDHDHHIGNPALQFATINPARARAAVARQTAQNDTEARQTALQAFVDVCYLHGTSEGAHGITASGPDRDAYTACRDELMRLGLAQWKNPNRPRGGWRMVADPATTKALVGNHVA